MSIRKVVLLDYYDDKSIEELNKFQKDNNIKESLKKVKKVSKEKYLKEKKDSNEIEEILVIKDKSDIKDYCHIYGEKDTKMCSITFPKLDLKRKGIISLIVSYAQNDLDMKEVFVKIDSNDKNMLRDLEELGYESLGEENGTIIYLKEDLEKINKGRYNEISK